jgi:hypothetical protein
MFVLTFTQMLSLVMRPPSSRRCAHRAAGQPRYLAVSMLLASMLLAACSTPSPPKPAMVAVGTNGNYGYAEVMLEPDRYQVSYLTPRLKVSNSRADREADIVAEKARAHDLALWRAAQLGREKGFAALKIVDAHTDSDVDTYVQRSYQPSFYGYYGYGYRPYRHYPGGFGPVPWFPGDYPYGYWPDDYYYQRTTSSLRVNSRLEIRFFKTSTEGAQSIDAVIDDMSKKYAQATYP